MAEPVLVTDASAVVFGALPDWNLSPTDHPSQGCTLSATSEADPVETPVELLQDGRVSEWWEATDGSLENCIIVGTLAEPQTIGAIGLAGSNISTQGKVRFRVSATSFAARTRVIPASIVSQVRVTGALTDIDEDPSGAPDGSYMTVNAGGLETAELHLQWSASASLEAVVPGCHAFRLKLENRGSTAVSVIIAKLYQSGTEKENLLADRDGVSQPLVIPAETTKFFLLPWSPSSLTTPTTAAPQLFLVFGHESDDEFRIHAIDLWRTDTVPSSDYFDTGLVHAYSDDILALVGGASLLRSHPSRAWVRERTHAAAVTSAGTYANIEDAAYVSVEIHDPNGGASIRASELSFGPAIAVRGRPDVNFSGRGRSISQETASGRDVVAYRRGVPLLSQGFLGDRATIDTLYELTTGRPEGLPFLYLPQPAGAKYFHSLPRLVRTDIGSSTPSMVLHERTPGGGYWRLDGLVLREVY